MADDKITMTVQAMARTMSNAVLRERRRCAQIVGDRADVALGDGDLPTHAILDVLRESILATPSPQVVPTPAGQVTDPGTEPMEEDAAGLPPHRDRDDIDEGMNIVQARSAAARLRQGGTRAGFLTD